MKHQSRLIVQRTPIKACRLFNPHETPFSKRLNMEALWSVIIPLIDQIARIAAKEQKRLSMMSSGVKLSLKKQRRS